VRRNEDESHFFSPYSLSPRQMPRLTRILPQRSVSSSLESTSQSHRMHFAHAGSGNLDLTDLRDLTDLSQAADNSQKGTVQPAQITQKREEGGGRGEGRGGGEGGRPVTAGVLERRVDRYTLTYADVC
jgi:hypothetical protein